MRSIRTGAAIALVLLTAGSGSAQRSVVVDASGNPGADYESLQEAVTSVPDGTHLLVRDGAYGRLEIVGRSLLIEADTHRFAFLNEIVVRDLGMGQRVTVRGFTLLPEGPVDHAILIENCAGAVWLEDIGAQVDAQKELVRVADSYSVVLTRCALTTVGIGSSLPIVGLYDSSTTLFDTSIQLTSLATAIRVQDGFFGFYEGSVSCFGFYCGTGIALHLTGTDPRAELQGVAMNGLASPLVTAGTLNVLPSEPRTLQVSSPVYDDELIEVQVEGEPGDLVWAGFSFEPSAATFLRRVDVPLFLASSAFIGSIVIGTVPSGGTLELSMPIGNLRSDFPSLKFYSQALFVAPGSESVLSEPTAITILDQALHRADYALSSTAEWMASPHENVVYGTAIASAGDVNGDGFDDAIIGDPGHAFSSETSSFRGAAYVHHGSARGLEASPAWSETGLVPVFPSKPRAFGARVGGAGDVNGDGFDDVLVVNAARGILYVYHGSTSGVSNADIWMTAATTALDINALGVGDVNGDEFDDLLFLAPQVTPQGIVYDLTLFLGSPSGLSASADWTARAPGTTQRRIVHAGDVDGDGYDDFITHARENRGSNRTVVELYRGGPGLPTLAWTYGDTRGHRDLAAAGDLNGDGWDDIVIGFYPNDIDIFFGSAAVLSSVSDETVVTPFYSSTRIRPVGDIDGDGYSDLFVESIGARFFVRGKYWFLLRGTPTGLRTSPSWEYRNETRYTSQITSAGDVNGDGSVDVLVADYDVVTTSVFEGGAVRAFHGLPRQGE